MARKLGKWLLLIVLTVPMAPLACRHGAASGGVAPSDELVTNPRFVQVRDDLPVGWSTQEHLRHRGTVRTLPPMTDTSGGILELRPNARNDDPENPFGIGQAISAEQLHGKTLRLQTAMRVERGAQAVALLLAMSSAGEKLDSASVWQSVPTRDFIEGEATLVVGANVSFLVVGAVVVGTEGRALFDFVDLQPMEKTADKLETTIDVKASRIVRQIPRTIYGTNIEWIYNANGLWDGSRRRLQPRLLELAGELGLGAVRFPGGVFADYYHWRDGVGPPARRPVRPHVSDANTSPNGFGTHEVLAFSRTIGAEPMFQVNIVTGTSQEAADWVAYCNKENHAERRANGAPSPFDVRLWEVGNEPYMKPANQRTRRSRIPAKEYAKRYLGYARAMKAVDKDILVGAAGGHDFGRYRLVEEEDWNRILLEQAGSEIDFLSIHNGYAPALFTEDAAGFYDVYAAMLAFPERVRTNLRQIVKDIETYAPEAADRMRLAVTEWGPFFHTWPSHPWVDHTKTLGSALYVASLMQVFLRAERVEIANFFKLNSADFMGWIGPNGIPKPAYYAFQIYARHFGDLLVSTETTSPGFDTRPVGFVDAVENVPYVDAVSSLSTDGEKLYVVVVNKHFERPFEARVHLEGFSPSSSGVRRVLSAPSLDANNGNPLLDGWARQVAAPENSMFEKGKPDTAVIRESAFESFGENFVVTLPPLSVTALELNRQGQ